MYILMTLLSSFQLATHILTFQTIKTKGKLRIRRFTKLSEDKRILFLEPVVKAKIAFVLSTEKRLVVSFWTFFKYLGNQGELVRTETTKKFC